ncbi:diguanylate cyclase [Paracidovorax citrulli]
MQRYNDRDRHEVGDDAVTAIARCIKPSSKPTDFAGRNGGKEFTVHLHNAHVSGAASPAQAV